jgi:hypothetical protein
MTLWEERAARNEAVFRDLNEWVRAMHEDHPAKAGARFVCECAEDTCTARIALPLETYERVRENPRLFFVRPGHERLELEQVVEEDEGFLIVRKNTATSARIAEQTDPRG